MIFYGESKYNIGDEVWIDIGNHEEPCFVHGRIESVDVHYADYHPSPYVCYDVGVWQQHKGYFGTYGCNEEKAIFKTKEEIVAWREAGNKPY